LLVHATAIDGDVANQEGRKQIIEMLWEIAMADCVVHEFEPNLVWRVA